VANRQFFISPAVAGDLLADYLAMGPRIGDKVESLTPRERQVLQLVAEGKTSKEISGSLGLSERTVQRHRYLLMKRLGIHTTAQLVLFALKNGILDGATAVAASKRA
jgi:DNA-binding NarL/FixJ family response regulator